MHYTNITILYFGMIFALALMLPLYALAQSVQTIGQFGDWAAFHFNEDGKKVCFMSASPRTHKGNYTQRGQIFASVTHRPGDATRDTFSYTAGYPYKEDSDVTLVIDGQTFKLFTDGDKAWAPDQATDSAIAKAIVQGSGMQVKGTSSRGTLTTDSFGLNGTGKAYEAITKTCGL